VNRAGESERLPNIPGPLQDGQKTDKQAKILTASLIPLAINFRLLIIFTATLLQVLFSNASLTSPQAPLT